MSSIIYKKRKRLFNEFFITKEYTDELDDEIDSFILSVWNRNGLSFYKQNIGLWYMKTAFVSFLTKNNSKFNTKVNKLYLMVLDELYDEVLSNWNEIKDKFYEELLMDRRNQKILDIKNKIDGRRNN